MVIDCDTGYAGTFRTIEKSRGHVVLDETTPDRKIDMIQTSVPKIDDQFCQLHQKAASPAVRQASVSIVPPPGTEAGQARSTR